MIRWLDKNSIKNKRVLIRVDFNVPLKNGKIVDDFRIKAHLPTLSTLIKSNNAVIIIAHLGKPNGRKNTALSLRPVGIRLAGLLKMKVIFVDNPFSKKWINKMASAPQKSVFLIENLRFWPGEEKNSFAFAEALANLGELFVQDAFGVIHRNHASVTGISRLLPSYGGRLLRKELESLRPFISKPKRPFVIVMGGAKISTKLHLLRAFIKRADRVLLGGALANTVLASLHFPIGKSFFEKKELPMVKNIINKDGKIFFPHDVVVAKSPDDRKILTKSINGIGKNDIILDIGKKTRKTFIRELKKAKTIFWNGPLGLAEKKAFGGGTLFVAKGLSKIRAYKVIGGGDLIAFFEKNRLAKNVTHIATGGGSALTVVAGLSLPGLIALEKSK